MPKEQGFLFKCTDCGGYLTAKVTDRYNKTPWVVHLEPCKYCVDEKVANKFRSIIQLIKEKYL
jgi:hypothetical protein